jgi:hypothetical protein
VGFRVLEQTELLLQQMVRATETVAAALEMATTELVLVAAVVPWQLNILQD